MSKPLKTKHRNWRCPGCKKAIKTLPTVWAPEHRCNPDAPGTHKRFDPVV